MDNLSKKLASNDKMLEININKMESFSSAIKDQHSFNKMLESQIFQLASSVPTANPGKISGQPEELESANLVNIYFADLCSSKTEEGPRWTD
jgi:phage-related tail protein